MKTLITSILLFLIIIGCQNPTSTENSSNQIIFKTDKTSYSKTDSITVYIENNTNSPFKIFLRCGSYLEMYYQKKENNSWSKNLWFPWMRLYCPSLLDTIKEHNNYKFIFLSDLIDSSGTYRLILSIDTLIVSNSFDIK
jgi:hypothetical protein